MYETQKYSKKGLPWPFSAGDVGLIPGRGTKIPQDTGKLSSGCHKKKAYHDNEDPTQSK